MSGEYLRVTLDELGRVAKEPAWAQEFAVDVQETESESDLPPGEARHLSTYKTWHAIAFLLERIDFPVDVVHGEESFDEAEDWGYGPPRYLPVERVHTAAEALAATSFDTLIAGVTPAMLTQADIYPHVWDEPDSLEWVRRCYEPLVPYFAGAARQRQAMLVWID